MPKASTPYNYLLDDYPGASVAYSLRKLRSSYSGSAIRVRRSSDNTEQDIGFSNNLLDESSLLSFCGAGDGFVTRIYDQSGVNNYAGQGTLNRQPLIVSSGATITRNSKPSMLLFAGSTERFLEELLTSTIATVSHSAFILRAPDFSASTTGSFGLSSTSSINQYESIASSSTNITGLFRNGGTENVITGLAYTNNQLYIISRHTTATTNRLLAVNNTNTYTSATTLASFNATYVLLNRVRRSDTITGRGYLSEYVLFNSNQTSNRTGIETNMNSFYSTY
jgi:hypothetical protein